MRKKLLSLSSLSTQPLRVNFWLLHAVTQSLFLCLLCFPPRNADIRSTKYNYGMFSRIATNSTCRVHIYIIISGRAVNRRYCKEEGKAQTTSVLYPHIRKWGLTAFSASLCLSVDVCRPVLQPEWTGVGVSQALIRAVWNPPPSPPSSPHLSRNEWFPRQVISCWRKLCHLICTVQASPSPLLYSTFPPTALFPPLLVISGDTSSPPTSLLLFSAQFKGAPLTIAQNTIAVWLIWRKHMNRPVFIFNVKWA